MHLQRVPFQENRFRELSVLWMCERISEQTSLSGLADAKSKIGDEALWFTHDCLGQEAASLFW
jgi:hypothetical protein